MFQTGWEHRRGGAIPILDGYVVCEEVSGLVIDAWHQEENRKKEETRKKQEIKILKRFASFVF